MLQDDIVKILIDKGIPVNAQDKNNWTALHFACHIGNLEVVKMLTDGGADVEIPDKEQKRPLAVAVQFGRTDIVQYLVGGIAFWVYSQTQIKKNFLID